MPKFEQILGIRFFNGTASEAVEHVNYIRGYAVAPAAPALANILRDAGYLCALSKADVAIADSGFMVLLWRLLRGRKLRRISGLRYLQTLLDISALRESGRTFFILPSVKAREKTVCWLCSQGFDISERDCYIAPMYHDPISDPSLVELLNSRRPAHVIVGIGGGIQEKLGFYLREHLSYRPAIHCIGAALAFLTGDQKPIPMWADRIYLGWFLRLARAPHRYARRFAPAFRLPGMIWRYGREMPPLKITK
jgi:N-acetylglucosaminyldiphosphoundecaprenol N-acetyl-beta-D-mannosaminyltransferase